MKAYPNYKDSGVEWLGEIPAHWDVLRLGSQFVERNQKVSDNDFAPLSVTKKGILPRLERAAKSTNGDNRKKVCSGDFVINSRSDRKGSSGISQDTGSVSLINTVLTPISLDGRYVHHFFRSHSFQEEFYRVGHGIVDDLWSTKYADMRTIMIPIPTEDEQQQIAHYVDWQTTKINKYIKTRKKLITLLKEQKQTIINEAVTKGLNPTVPMQDSGMKWLGEIPAHWKKKRIKNISCLNGRIGFRGYSTTDLVTKGNGAITLSPSNMKLYGMEYSKCSYLSWEKYYESPEIMVSNGDMLFVKTGSTYGKTCLVENLPMEATINPQILLIKNLSENTEFIKFIFLSEYFRFQIESSVIGGIIPTISQTKVGNFSIFLPQEEEQVAIARFIEKETALIDKIIAHTEKLIELIAQYRTRLISDAVTGKIDVRSVEIPDFAPGEEDVDIQDEAALEDELIMEESEK